MEIPKLRRKKMMRNFQSQVTARRLTGAKKQIAKEQAKAGMFADQLKLDTPAERVQKSLNHADAVYQGIRDLHARFWRLARKILRSMPTETRAEILTAWAKSSIPGDSAYFLDFMRRWGYRSEDFE